jgi:hypothetical protein
MSFNEDLELVDGPHDGHVLIDVCYEKNEIKDLVFEFHSKPT